ncbi:MAG: outer membrane beta-barrel protein [Bacteroidetes bacterium]|nr:outer membrane beta-barrel protein [Bacteroidota bacterium]MBS1539687.1 outer membrane beta-barrel protein [Bacteroidota bacterium]
MRLFLIPCLTVICFSSFAQEVESFGVFGGFNIPFTIDQGLRNDPRFYGRFTVRGTPIGFSYGYDKVGYGFLFTPNYMQIGQKFTIVNYAGGTIGTRDVQMNYFSLPLALRLHVNDVAFFRLSVVAAVNFSYLVKGQETLNIDAVPSVRKLAYPPGVSVPQSPDYQVTYNGVFVPNLNNSVYVSNDKFSRFQIFAGLGFHSDFDFDENWSISFDGRANFGIFDPRTASYIHQLQNPSGPPDVNSNAGAPDLYGQRRDVYLSATFGISRIFQFKPKFREKTSAPIRHVRSSPNKEGSEGTSSSGVKSVRTSPSRENSSSPAKHVRTSPKRESTNRPVKHSRPKKRN